MIELNGLEQKLVKKKIKSFSQLRNLKNKRYHFWRLDTWFNDIKRLI